MTNSSAKDVDTYIADSSPKARPVLIELQKIIKSTIPNAEVGIKWGFPFYKYNSTYTHYSEYKHHVALGFGSDLQKKDREVLENHGYATGQKRIQIKFDQKVPTTMIRKILKSQGNI